MASGGSDQNAKYALSKLLQMGTVVEYESVFVVHENRVTGIFESLLTSFYISRLKLTLQIDLLRTRPITLEEAFALAWIIKARFGDERATAVEAVSTSMIATYEEHGCQDGFCMVATYKELGYPEISCWEKGDLGAITSKGGPPDHMRASEKELTVLKSPLEQKSMFKCQKRMLRQQEQQQLAKDAKIQRRIWDPGIKGGSDQNAEYALSKLLQMVQIDLVMARPITLGEAFALDRITKACFKDERTTTIIAKPSELNIAVQVQDIKEATLHTSNKVEAVSTSMVATYEEHGCQDGFCMVVTYEEHGCLDGSKPITTRSPARKKVFLAPLPPREAQQITCELVRKSLLF
nr:reverse transcriptase [Tanacetum cinerariifolium]